MLNIFNPTLDAPTKSSPAWYVSFHSGFYLSQITNNVLFASLTKIAKARAEAEYLGVAENVKLKGGTKHEVDDVVASIRDYPSHLKMMFTAMMLDPGDSFEKDIDIDVDSLLRHTSAEDWYGVVTGFLNLWEFLFLYGLVENTLKDLANAKSAGANGLVSAILRKYPVLQKRLEDEYCLDRNLLKNLWDIYYLVRNICAHSHGFLTEEDVVNIREKRENLDGALENFREKLGVVAPIEAALMEHQAATYFGAKNVKSGIFYLLSPAELNLFRNFICLFMSELQHEFSGGDADS